MPRPFLVAGDVDLAFEIIRNPAGGRSAHRVRTRSARNVCCGAKVTIGPEVYSGRERC